MKDKRYLEIIEINNSLKAFDEFLKEEHSNEECKDFCLKIIENNPNFSVEDFFNKNKNCDISTVRMLKVMFNRYVERIYVFSGIEKTIKPKSSKVKTFSDFIKRKTLEIKNIIVKSLIFICSILLFVASFYVEDSSWNSVLVAIATGLFSSLVFERLLKFQRDYREKRRRNIRMLVSKCKLFKDELIEIKNEFDKNNNEEINFVEFIFYYERLYDFFQDLKSKISFNTQQIKIEAKTFECYYQDYIEKEIQNINMNYSDVKKLYLKRKEEYKETLLKPYILTIELLNSIIDLYDFNSKFIKKEEEVKNG